MNSIPKAPNPNANNDSDSGGCVPMITLLVGLGMVGVGLLAVLNTAFGWELVLEVYGAAVEIPKYWDATIGVLFVGGIIAAVGYLIGTPRFLRFYRKNKLLVILGSVGILVGTFLLLNEYDKSIKRRNAIEFAKMDSIRAANPEAFADEDADDEPPYNPYADRKVTFLVTNPTVDTMQVYVDEEQAFEVKPYEIGKGEMAAGAHEVVAKVNGKAVQTVALDLPERTRETQHEVTVINVDSFFNIAVLNFADYFDADNRKRKGAKTINYRLESLHWHEHIFTIDEGNISLVLPRHASFDFSYGKAMKLVFLPDGMEGDKDKAFDFAIWKFIDEEKKGIVQDGLDFYMLSPAERKKAIRGRLADDEKRFENQ